MQLIQKLEPIGISPGVVVIKTYTINGVYWILFDGNQRGAKRIAHFIHESFAVWHSMIEGELKKYEIDSYFTLKNVDILLGIEGINNEHVSFRELQTLCTMNGNTIPYDYK